MEIAPRKQTENDIEKLKIETKIIDKDGNPLLMHNRSHTDFENFEIGKRNLENKKGVNKIGFFFSSRSDLEHYGKNIKSGYLNIKKPFDITDLGPITDYKSFRDKLTGVGITDKELAGYDLQFQEFNMKRNKRLGRSDGLTTPSGVGMYDARHSTFNFFDAGEGFYLRKLLESKGFDGITFSDEGEVTVIAFYPEQIIAKSE